MSSALGDTTGINSDSVNDPLFDCLVFITHTFQLTYSRDALCAGLPLENHRMTPELFVRAAERIGLTAKIIKRPLERINNIVLPAVIILDNQNACVLHRINDDNTAEVIFPHASNDITKLSVSELNDSYSGYAIFVKQSLRFPSSENQDPSSASDLSWFWGTIWRYRAIYFQVVIAAFIINLFSLLSPLFVMTVYDRVIPNYATTTLWVLFIGIMTIFIFDGILRMLRSYMIDICGKKSDIVISSYLFQTILGMQLSHKPASVGAFINNIREFDSIRDFITSTTLIAIVDVPFILLFIALVAYLGGWLIVIPVIIISLVLIISLLIAKPMRTEIAEAVKANARKNAILVESITGLETVKCHLMEGKMQRHLEDSVSHAAKHSMKARVYSAILNTTTNYAQQSIYVLMVTFGVYLIHAGDLTVGALIACNILASRIIAPLSQIAGISAKIQQVKISMHALRQVMDIPIERSTTKRYLNKPIIKGDIEFDSVCFTYPGQSIPAVDKLSFKLAHGERLAVLGPIGSGKSTIEKLLLGLFDPQSGNIRIDGIDINQIDPVDLRKHIGYVSQDNFLFYGTVRENIIIGKPLASDEEVIAASRIAGVTSFVDVHPKGYDMMIGERGEGISGGQRQSIAIARALLPNPSICLFDEPSSFMDKQSENRLIKQLSSYLEHKTVLLVTHRFSMLTLANRILVMDKGRLVIDGPKDRVISVMQNQKTPQNKS